MSGTGERISWFDQHGQNQSQLHKYGTPKMHGLVANIFFPTAVSDLDDDDRAVLDAMVNNVAYRLLGGPLQLQMVGYADPRGSDSYNYQLALHRAHRVKDYVDSEVAGTVKSNGYSSVLHSRGDHHPSGHWAFDRRVDVFSSYVPKRPPLALAFQITAQYDGPLSDKFKFRVFLGASVGIGPVAGQDLSIEIQNSRTGRSRMYTYTGVGFGVSFGIDRPTGWTEKTVTEKTVPVWLDVDDFEGSGRVGSAGVIEGGMVFVFDGPKERGRSSESIALGFDGWDLNVGFQGDVSGYWHAR